jgi:5-methylcytosine-specific restriction enzyme subunit McrC
MKADSSFSYWPELLTYPTGRPTNKRRVYIVNENTDTEIPTNHFFVNGQLQIYPSVDDNDFLTVHKKKSSLKFQAGRYIGLIPLNDYVMLDVRPRVPLKNLTRIMRIAEGQPRELDRFLSYYSECQEALPSMIDYFARALIDRVSDIAFDGLHREYARKSQGTSFPRGRIHIGDTVRRYSTRGIRHHVAASWYEATVDTPPNRCLKYTLWFLAGHYNSTNKKNRNDLLRRLERSYHIFSGVALDTSLGFLRSTTVNDPETLPSIRAYYKPALYLALLILQNRGISFTDRRRGILLSSLLINLQTTFEKYSRNVLRERLRDIETKVRVLDGSVKGGQKPLFDEPISPKRESQMATPDIVFNRASPSVDGSYPTLLVAEVKYKDFVEPKRSEINQAGMYALSYGAPVVIVHPRVEEKTHGMYPLPLRAPVTIYHYAIDLAATDPEAEEAKFAKSFRALLHV